METMPFTSHRDVFERLAKVSSYASLSREEQLQYDYDVKKARDYREEMAYAVSEGIAQGRVEGKAEGIAQGKAEGIAQGRVEGIAQGKAEGEYTKSREIAYNLKLKGMDPVLIASVTGLSLEEVKIL